jgi:hypothetical protein
VRPPSPQDRAPHATQPARARTPALDRRQILLSQLPDFSALGFVSALGALMSVCYCAIATGLAAAYRPAGPVDFSPKHDTPVEQRVFDIFAAITTMLFAYGGHNIALEIQATLPSPPTIRRMMRGVHIAFVVTGARRRGAGVRAAPFTALRCPSPPCPGNPGNDTHPLL